MQGAVKVVTAICTRVAPGKQSTSTSEDNVLNLHAMAFLAQDDLTLLKEADRQLNAGEKRLPELARPRKSFETQSAFFKHLVRDIAELYIYLRSYPVDINLQDEDGKTIAHHSAEIQKELGRDKTYLIHQLLFATPEIDITMQDDAGDTPMHIAGRYMGSFGPDCYEELEFSFLAYFKRALQYGFNFATKGKDGFTLLHFAAFYAYEVKQPGWKTYQSFSVLLQALKEEGLPNFFSVINAVSDEGITVFSCCVANDKWDLAQELINAGADPAACGAQQCVMLLQKFDDMIDRLARSKLDEEAKAKRQIKQLKKQKESEIREVLQASGIAIMLQLAEPTPADMRRNARAIRAELKKSLENIESRIKVLNYLKCLMQVSHALKS